MSSALQFAPLTPERWSDLVQLFGSNGACGGCWCMWWKRSREQFRRLKGASNRRAFKTLVDRGDAPGNCTDVSMSDPQFTSAAAPPANEAARELAYRSIPGALAYLILLLVPISATSYARDYPRTFLAAGASIFLFATARLVFAWWMTQHQGTRSWRWWGFLIGTYGCALGGCIPLRHWLVVRRRAGFSAAACHHGHCRQR